MSDPIQDSSSASASRRRRRWIIVASVVGVVAALVAVKAYYCSHFGWHRWGGPVNSRVLNERIEFGVRHVLSDVDATAEQQAKVTGIMQAAAKDVTTLRDRHFADIKKLRDVFAAPSIDRSSLEAVRAEEISLADEASKRMLQGIADSAEVLTPEQRAKLIARFESHSRWHSDAN